MPGPKPDLERRRLAAELRDQGLSLSEIGCRLGVTRQTVRYLLHPKLRRKAHTVRCAACGTVIRPDGGRWDVRKTLCLACLARTPGATFGQRLRAHRVAAGLSQQELARRAEVAGATICKLEAGHTPRPYPDTVARLAAVLGQALAAEGP